MEEKKVGKVKAFVNDKKQKVKKFVGEHMWIKDAGLLIAGGTIACVVEGVLIPIAKEVSKEVTKIDAIVDQQENVAE